MAMEKNLLTFAAVGVGAMICGLQGAKKVCSGGHAVADGLRWTADKIDAGSTWGENKCDAGIAYCQQAKEMYETEAAMAEAEDIDAVVEQKKNGTYNGVCNVQATMG